MATSAKVELVLMTDKQSGKEYFEVAGLKPGSPVPDVIWTDPQFTFCKAANIPALDPGWPYNAVACVIRVIDKR